MKPVIIGNAELWLGDCMDYMKPLLDKMFDLAIVDPPYGIGAGKGTEIYISNNKKWDNKGIVKNECTIYGDWDSEIPDEKYFQELFRVSNNQIIWGGNYFNLPPSPCYIVWDKENGDSFFADGELAWTSYKTKLRIFRYLSCGFMGSHKNRDTRIHPTQKPVKLYEWLLTNYAKPGQVILDTHLGSGSSAIACNKMGYKLVGIEKDEDYFNAACERIDQAQRQGRLFV